MEWMLSGRCWKFGDNLAVDADLTKKEFALSREIRPEVLREYVMCGVDPDFAKKASPGDILVAGRRFAHGNPHIQGLLGIAVLGLGLVVESIPRGSYRNAINAGLKMLPHCPGVTSKCETGDELQVDFRAGTFKNRTRGQVVQYEPLPQSLLDTIELGGWMPMVARRLAQLRAFGVIPP